jgi:hypothetical protein
MSTRNLPWGKRRPVRKSDNLTTISEPIVYKMWEPRRLTTLCAFTACWGMALRFFTHHSNNSRKLICATLKHPIWIASYTTCSAACCILKINWSNRLFGLQQLTRPAARPRSPPPPRCTCNIHSGSHESRGNILHFQNTTRNSNPETRFSVTRSLQQVI